MTKEGESRNYAGNLDNVLKRFYRAMLAGLAGDFAIEAVYDIGIGHAVFDRVGRFYLAPSESIFEGVEIKKDPAITRQALARLRQNAGYLQALYASCRMPDPAFDKVISDLDARLAECDKSAVGGIEPSGPGIGN